MTGAPPKPFDCQKPPPGAPVIGFSDLLGQKTFDILITRRALKSARVTVTATNYYDAIEAALKKARCGKVDWNEETAIVQHDCENCDPNAPPSLP